MQATASAHRVPWNVTRKLCICVQEIKLNYINKKKLNFITFITVPIGRRPIIVRGGVVSVCASAAYIVGQNAIIIQRNATFHLRIF